MKKDLKFFLDEMLEYIEDVEKYTRNIQFEDFLNNDEKYDACVFKIALIWETWVKINKYFKEDISDFPFLKMSGIRNIIIHDYIWINEKIIWDTIKTSLPELKKIILKLL